MQKKEKLEGRWVTFKDIEPHQKQIEELLYESTTKFHYPNWKIEKEFFEERFSKLKQFLQEGKAYVWCIFDKDTIVCFYWCYTIPFINKKRWEIASFIINSEYRNKGIGRSALKAGEEKARELGCDEMALMYVPWNKNAAHLYEDEGYEVTRIEAVKKL